MQNFYIHNVNIIIIIIKKSIHNFTYKYKYTQSISYIYVLLLLYHHTYYVSDEFNSTDNKIKKIKKTSMYVKKGHFCQQQKLFFFFYCYIKHVCIDSSEYIYVYKYARYV